MRRGAVSFLLLLIVFTTGALSVAFTPPHNCTQRQIMQSLLKPGTLEIWNTGSHSVAVNSRFNPLRYSSTIPYGKPLFTGGNLDPKGLSMGQDPLTGYYFINFTMKGAATSKLASFTSSHIGGYITITLNKVVVSSPMIGYALPGKGQFQMSPRALMLLGIKCANT